MSEDLLESILHDLERRPDWEHLLLNLGINPLRQLAEEAGQAKNRDMKSSLLRYCDYQDRLEQHWFQPQLETFKDYLLAERGLAPTSVSHYASRVRNAYRELARRSTFQDVLYSAIPGDYSDEEKRSFTEDFWGLIRYKITQPETYVDFGGTGNNDEELLKNALPLARSHIDELLSAPDLDTLKGRRDRAIIAILLCAGLRVKELVNLDFPDLLGDSAVQVRNGEQVDRVIPFGDLIWGLPILRVWIRAAGITSGPLFISIHRNDQIMLDESGHPHRLSAVAISLILRGYPIHIDGCEVIVKPQHLRYMYGSILLATGATYQTVVRNMGYRGWGRGLMRSVLLRRLAAKGRGGSQKK